MGLAGCGGCGPRRSGPNAPSTKPSGALSVAIEGPCPKLRVWDAGRDLAIVWGTYGLEGATPIEARTTLATGQAFGFVRKGKVELVPALLAGLPRNAQGYVPADIELGGRFPEAAWLSRVDTRLARVDRGALFERQRSYLVWEGNRWTESPTGSDVVLSGLRTPPFLEGAMCTRLGEGVRFARHATERLPSGEVITAGRCEDEMQRAKSGVIVAALASARGEWRVAEMPPSPMFEEIVNVDLVYAKKNEAYLYAYMPYDESPRPAYVMRYDGARWSPVALPFDGPVVSMARADDGRLWAVARFREVYTRLPPGDWTRVTLPPARFADRAPPDLRVIEIQTTGRDAWIHAAYPIVIRAGDADPKPSRSHVLYTTRAWGDPLFCDAASPAAHAVRAKGRTLEAARAAHVGP
ncbi:MAG: hypothetical protein KF819_32600 [Labilithrix sp.]|nr:hypothetical protein [Labilithrix sp.]